METSIQFPQNVSFSWKYIAKTTTFVQIDAEIEMNSDFQNHMWIIQSGLLLNISRIKSKNETQ